MLDIRIALLIPGHVTFVNISVNIHRTRIEQSALVKRISICHSRDALLTRSIVCFFIRLHQRRKRTLIWNLVSFRPHSIIWTTMVICISTDRTQMVDSIRSGIRTTRGSTRGTRPTSSPCMLAFRIHFSCRWCRWWGRVRLERTASMVRVVLVQHIPCRGCQSFAWFHFWPWIACSLLACLLAEKY